MLAVAGGGGGPKNIYRSKFLMQLEIKCINQPQDPCLMQGMTFFTVPWKNKGMLTKHCGRKGLGLLEAGHCVSFALGLVSYKFEFTEILININAHLTPSQCILW